MLDVRVGRCEFVQGPIDPPDEIQLPTANVILEHARRQDEAEKQ